MKSVLTYALLLILTIALFELGQRTSIHIFGQLGLALVLTSLVLVVRDLISVVREIDQLLR